MNALRLYLKSIGRVLYFTILFLAVTLTILVLWRNNNRTLDRRSVLAVHLHSVTLHPIVGKREGKCCYAAALLEFRNNSFNSATFVLPQDGSSEGWLDPKYEFDVKDRWGFNLPSSGRCGSYGGEYNSSTLVSVPPGGALYVYSGIPGRYRHKKKIVVSLKYSVSSSRLLDHLGSGHITRMNDRDWPKDIFVGEIRSNTVTIPLENGTELAWSPSLAEVARAAGLYELAESGMVWRNAANPSHRHFLDLSEYRPTRPAGVYSHGQLTYSFTFIVFNFIEGSGGASVMIGAALLSVILGVAAIAKRRRSWGMASFCLLLFAIATFLLRSWVESFFVDIPIL